jgi:hypothetical protein
MGNPRHILLALLLVAGCQAAVSSSASPSAPAVASTSSAASPTAAPSFPPFPSVELPPQSRARLAVAMDAYANPGEPTAATLDAGTEVIVASGPREVELATWYEVQFPPDGDSARLFWVRVDDPTALTPVDLPCPSSADEMLGMLAWDRVRCFGDAPVTVEGTVDHCQGGVVFVEPGWLAYACWGISDANGTITIHAAPDSGIAFPDEVVRARLTGHFDDPASTSCLYLGDPDPLGSTPSASEQVLLCREAFVVDVFDILEVIGPSLS